jgi:hypothetical protein
MLGYIIWVDGKSKKKRKEKWKDKMKKHIRHEYLSIDCH